VVKQRIPYTKPSITELEIQYATDAVANGWGERCYEYIGRFEQTFSKHLGVKHVIATSSCTGALHMGLAALGIGPGDEVILADINWIASAAPITYLGATPVLVDILPDTWCIDPARAEEAITSKTKAIIAVHLYGNLCDMDALQSISARYGIPIVEDAAEAIGSTHRNRTAGSIGKFGAFSFHGTKTITTGEGGAFVTNDDELYEQVLTLSNHGRSRNQKKQFWPDIIGFKYKMSNVQAAIGCAQVERIDNLISEKRSIYERYVAAFEGSSVILNPRPDDFSVPGYWMVNAVFPSSQMNVNRRQRIIETLDSINADARVFFWPLTSTGHFDVRTENPIANCLTIRALNLPSAFGMTDAMIDEVCHLVREFAESPPEEHDN
jgi:perosamine synthetase